jgi:hypothetical protein
MNSDTPFNPLPLPDGLMLAQETSSPQSPPPGPGAAQTKQTRRPRAKRKSKRPTTTGCEAGNTSEGRWRRIKGRLNARLSQMDPETLKRILTAAGVAAGVIIAILIAIKLTPIAMVLLGLLGLAFLLRLWDRLRFQPPPF